MHFGELQPVLYLLHVSAAAIMLFLSVYSSKGNMLSTPSPLSLSALSPSVSPTSSLPMASGNSWLSECSSPFVSTHWLALRSPKSRAAWGAGSQLSAGAAQKKSEEKNKGRKSPGGFTTTCLDMSPLFLSASPAVMRINGVYHISLMSFCQMECSSGLLCLPSPPPPPPPSYCPADSLHPLRSYLLTRLHCSVCSAVTWSHTVPQHNRPLITQLFGEGGTWT